MLLFLEQPYTAVVSYPGQCMRRFLGFIVDFFVGFCLILFWEGEGFFCVFLAVLELAV